MKVLITGFAGFIGNALGIRLAELGHAVTGIDNLNSYYDPRLKLARLRRAGISIPATLPLKEVVPSTGSHREPVAVADIPVGLCLQSEVYPGLSFRRLDICDREAVALLFQEVRPDVVVNLAAQAGVRYSLENPYSYVETNVMGFLNLLEGCRANPVKHFVYASSSSVYGENSKVPFGEDDRIDRPVSLYAATKKSDELMAEVYNHLYGIPATGLRFFTVYGPWGRPDMAPMLFSTAILEGKPIKVFNHGDMSRDFTYIDDIVEGVVRVVENAPRHSDRGNVYNIGCGHPESLSDFISILEQALGKKAEKEMLPMQPGDVPVTWADTEALKADYGYCPSVTLSDGIARFAEWRLQWEAEHR